MAHSLLGIWVIGLAAAAGLLFAGARGLDRLDGRVLERHSADSDMLLFGQVILAGFIAAAVLLALILLPTKSGFWATVTLGPLCIAVGFGAFLFSTRLLRSIHRWQKTHIWGLPEDFDAYGLLAGLSSLAQQATRDAHSNEGGNTGYQDSDDSGSPDKR